MRFWERPTLKGVEKLSGQRAGVLGWSWETERGWKDIRDMSCVCWGVWAAGNRKRS